MKWIFRRCRRYSRLLTFARSLPPKLMTPLVGRSRPTITLPIVVLPQPDSPTSPNVSPRQMLRCRLGSV